jgi:hypothetical protein
VRPRTHALAFAYIKRLSAFIAMNVGVKHVPYQPGQSQRFNDALALGASPLECSTTPLIRAQKESFRAPPWGCGGFRFDPVSRLCLARPLAVNPAPCLTDNFSPRPTESEVFFAMATSKTLTSCRHEPFWRSLQTA